MSWFWFRSNSAIEVAAILFGLNAVSGSALALLVFSIARRLGLGNTLSLGVTGGALLSSAF